MASKLAGHLVSGGGGLHRLFRFQALHHEIFSSIIFFLLPFSKSSTRSRHFVEVALEVHVESATYVVGGVVVVLKCVTPRS